MEHSQLGWQTLCTLQTNQLKMLLDLCQELQKVRTHTQLEAVFMAPTTLEQQVECKAKVDIIYRQHMG